MKKNLSRFSLVSLSMLSIVLLVIFSFTPPDKTHPKKSKKKKANTEYSGCSTSCDIIFTDCYGGPGCSLPGCTSVWKVSNVNSVTKGAKTVSVSGMSVCYVPSGSPTWSSYSQIGRIMNTTYRPFGTRVVSASATSGGTFQVTIFSSGDFYFQQISGPVAPGPAVTLSFSYSF